MRQIGSGEHALVVHAGSVVDDQSQKVTSQPEQQLPIREGRNQREAGR